MTQFRLVYSHLFVFISNTFLQDDGDLLEQELDDIWEAAPKFPDVSDEQRIDVDSFVQIYRDIDDLFEEDLEEIEEEVEVIEEAISEVVDEQEEEEEQELEWSFKQICDKDGLVSKRTLMKWDEITKLFQDGLLGTEEFEKIWNKTRKSPGSSDQLDVEGFLSFNVALDDLFVFEDDAEDEMDDVEDEEIAVETPRSKSLAPEEMVEGDELPSGVLFAALSNEDYLVGMDELKRWSELQEMLADESLLPLELQNIYDGIPKASGDMLDEAGFTALYETIDSLFEEVDEEEEQDKGQAAQASNEAKTQLLALLEEMNSDNERLPCGLESTEQEEKVVMDIVNQLEQASSNIVREKQGKIQLTDMAGGWRLLYSSSSAMKFNKGLSGLGGSIPNGKFGGLIQNLQASK